MHENYLGVIGIGCFALAYVIFFVSVGAYNNKNKPWFICGNFFLHWAFVFFAQGFMQAREISIISTVLITLAVSSAFVIFAIWMYGIQYGKKKPTEIIVV